MGCDIHLIVEVQENGEWRPNIDLVFEGYDKKPSVYPDVPRDYEWFAIIANVRNYEERGLLPVIVEPRGIPSDATDEYRQMCESWEGDGHNHSWLRIDDFNSFDWDAAKTRWGWTYYHEKVIAPLAALASKYEDARMCFFFDN